MNLSSRVLSRLMKHQIDTLPLGEELTLPFYDGLSLVNIPSTIAQLLDAPGFGKPPIDTEILQTLGGPYEKIILLLVDAMGFHLFQAMMDQEKDLVWRRYLDRAVFSPLTSVCPSTTASALTSLWTGEAPIAHGIIGYEMWAKEFGMVINNIHQSAASARHDTGGLSRSGFEPHEFLDVPLLGPHLLENGVFPTTFIHSRIAHSGLSVMQMVDVDVQAYINESDLFISLSDYVNSRNGKRDYIYTYYSDIDTLMHQYNEDDERIRLQFRAFSSIFEEAFLNRLSDKVARDTLLILMADHGSKKTPIYEHFDLINHPDLTDCLVMQPTCEHRLPILFIKPGRIDFVKDYFAATWPEDFVLIDPEKAIEDGLFGKGPFRENVRERLGDLIVVPRTDSYLWWSSKPNHMAGRHGGLSREEMLVPFYALPLRELF